MLSAAMMAVHIYANTDNILVSVVYVQWDYVVKIVKIV